jgi:hypothetical protein
MHPGGVAVPGAAVSIAEGPNAGRRTTTTADGRFGFDNLRFGKVGLLVEAPPFREGRRWLYVTSDFPGARVEYDFLHAGAEGIDETLTGTIRATDAPCSSPFEPLHDGKPCQTFGPYGLPRTGTMRLQLVWRLPALNEVDFEVWRNGSRWLSSGSSIASGASEGLIGGALEGVYEFRVFYLGRSSQEFQLQASLTTRQ